jgi:hypothetical protein
MLESMGRDAGGSAVARAGDAGLAEGAGAMAASTMRATISRCAEGGRLGKLVPPGRLGGRLGGARICVPGWARAGETPIKRYKINRLGENAAAFNLILILANFDMKYTQKDC